MKRVSKAVAGILCAVVAFSASGCTKKSEKTDASSVTVIEVWSSDTSAKAVYTKLADEYNAGDGKKAGIKIDFKVKENDSYQQVVDLAFKSGNAPDLLMPTNVATMVEKDQLMPLNDIPGMEGLIEKRKPYTRDFYNAYNGNLYTLPLGSTTIGLLYNKDMFKKAGIVDKNGNALPPETWEEFRADAKKLTNKSKNEYGVVLPFKWSGWFNSDIVNPGMASLGISNGYDPRTGKYDFSGYEPIVNTFLGIKDDESYLPGAETIDNDVARARFAEGGIGMKVGFSFDVGVLNDQFPAKIDWGVAPIPVLDKDNKYLQPYETTGTFSVNKSTKVPKDKLASALNFFYGDDFAVELYKRGITVPCDATLIEGVELKDAKKGWKEFCDMLKISIVTPVPVKVDITNETTIGDNFINKVWVGKMSVKDALAHETKIRNDGIEKYKSMHPEYDGSKYINPDWDPVRK